MRKLYIFLSLILISSIFFGCNNKTELVISGTIEAKSYNLKSEVTGKVQRINLEEGQEVTEGDVIANIDDAVAKNSLAQAEELVKAKTAKLDLVTTGSRNQEINIAIDTLMALEKQYDVAANNYSYLKGQVALNQKLFDEGVISEDTLKQLVLKEKNAQSAMQSALYEAKGAENKISLLKEGALDSEINIARADLKSAFLTRDLAILTLGKYTIKASSTGILSDIFIDKGDMVTVGSNLGQIMDLSEKYVRAYIPQGTLNLISLNKEINIRIPAYPKEKFKGVITYISKEAVFTPKNVETLEAKENTVFEIKIDISDIKKDVLPGMSVEVVIPLE